MPETFTVDVICSWCQKPMGTKDGFTEPKPTHGICQECADKFSNPSPDGHKIAEKICESHVGLSGGGISDWIYGEQGEQYI